MAYLLALDQGTTSSRAIVFDAGGRVCGLAQQAFAQHFPAPVRVEHDPQDILRTQLDCAREALANAGVAAREVAAIGVANQRETTVLWERASGRALAPAIVWQDRRTAAGCERLRAAGWAEDVRAPGLTSIRTSPPPSSPGCSTTSPMRACAPSAASSPSAPSTAGWCGT